MKNHRTLILKIAAALVLTQSGCLQTRTAVKATEEKQVLRKQVQTLQQTTADVTVRFQEVDDEFRKLNGRVEVAEGRVHQLETQKQAQNSALEARMKEMNERMLVLQDAVTKLDGQVAELSSHLAAVQEAQRRAGAQAKTHQKSKGAYETAEDFFDKKEWKEAILNYEKYRKSTPKGKYYSMATYKIGVSFQELGLIDDAKVFFEEVLQKFPKTQAATKASIRLKSLKK